MSTSKKWLPFTSTLVIALAAAAGLYVWKGSEISDLESAAKKPLIGRLKADDAGRGPRGAPSSKAGGPEQAKVDKALRPTRNGMRSMFERAKHIMSMDRDDVLKLLDELEAKGGMRSPITGINAMAAYARLAELDPHFAMERALKQKGEMRDMGMFTVMNEWLSNDRKGALAWFAKSDDIESKKKYLTIASITNAGADPDLIAELSAGIDDPEARSKALLDSIGALAFTDPDAALKKLDEIQDPEEREKAEEKVYEGFLMRYPKKALDYAMAQPPGSKARENARNALIRWGEQDSGEALKWMTAQNKDVQKELFDTGDGKTPGWGFGKATVEEIGAAARQLSDQGQKDKLYAAWANSQSYSHPVEGLNQLHEIRDPELQKSTAGAIGYAIAQQGKTSDMTRWLETAQPNDTRDTAVASFARGIAQNNAAEGAVWAGKITNPTIRQETIQALKNPTPQAPSLQNIGQPGRRRPQ